jgi:TPR repeat protein
MKAEYVEKKKEYEVRKARAKALALRLTCTICGVKPKTLLNCPCGTTQYCSVACQKVDWRDRGHRTACKKIRNERAAEAARAEAPTPPPKEVFYGPAPRSHADEVRARIAAEHEAARLRREANPEPEPLNARYGSRCPVCYDDWDVNVPSVFIPCCARTICASCSFKNRNKPCLLCRAPIAEDDADFIAKVRCHVENDLPEAMVVLADAYAWDPGMQGQSWGLVQSKKKAAELYKRAVALGSAEAMTQLGKMYNEGGIVGVNQDQEMAIQLWRMAADRGCARGQHNMATMLHPESGRPDASYEEAYRYYKLAALQGLTEAEHFVGCAHFKGEGVDRDVGEARRWFTRAAAKGHENAAGTLRNIAHLSDDHVFRGPRRRMEPRRG